ncbi:hypothetical protein HDK64DRAFT_131176 [Phyllosticta capitalensis]|uniref:CCHC-type domain-containing protein n=1 Tax=Phyllosticta capitalensis TaxID=121624 RepID=A0ABR1YGD8_9PEZI
MTTPNGRSSKVSGPSNRLLSMKVIKGSISRFYASMLIFGDELQFMQRAAASQHTTPKSPSTPSGPPAKRQRTSAASSPATPTDYDAVQAALAAEEAKRAAAMERQAAEAGETRWVLSFMEPEKESRQKSALRVVSAGYADLDNDDYDDSEEDAPQPGRMSFGKKPPPPAQDKDGDSDSGSDSSEAEEDEDPTAAMIREQRKEAARAKRKDKRDAEAAKMAQLAASRKKKEVNLNKLKSISGGASNQSPSKDVECYGCGKKGHIRSECPSSRRRGRGSE